MRDHVKIEEDAVSNMLDDFDYHPPTKGLDVLKLATFAVLIVMTVGFWFVVLAFVFGG